MYVLNEEVKKLVKINETKFSEHGLTERYDLQEWIDSDPTILSKELGEDEDLLIIQKEFNRFDKTKSVQTYQLQIRTEIQLLSKISWTIVAKM